jgi:hypothetical protein
LRHVLFRIRDFSQVYSVIEDSFTKTEANFSIHDEFRNLIDTMASDFKKTFAKLTMTIDPKVPNKVRASQ